MTARDEVRTCFLRVIKKSEGVWNSPYVLDSHRPSWMSDEQWRQAVAFQEGKRIPTDIEILNSLERIHYGGRGCDWMCSHVPGIMVLEHFQQWCELIREFSRDPDLEVDEGL